MENLSTKQKILLYTIVAIIILFIVYYVYNKQENQDLTITNEIDSNIEAESSLQEINMIIVHITGAINKQGIVELKQGSRIADAIEKAGGSLETADLDKVNLAYVLEDGQKVYIPKIGDEIEVFEYITEGSGNNVIIDDEDKRDDTQININKASQTELELLPGIGPSIALKIIEYREENGKFDNIEDIKNVTGIGDSKYNNIKDKICVE